VHSATDQHSERKARALSVRAWGLRLTSLGLIGLFTGELARWAFNMTKEELTGTAVGTSLMWLFSGLFIGGMMIVLPFSTLLERRAHRLDGTTFDQWQLPGRIGWPLWVLVTAGSLFLVYLLVFHGIPFFLSTR
jgi:hypothetical protein